MSVGGFESYVDIEIYDRESNSWAQARFLVHGFDDVLWTDDLDDALAFLRSQIVDARDRESERRL